MRILFDILIIASVLAVLITLGFGLYSLYRGGEYGRARSNKLMRLRIALQAVAIVILITAFWWKSQNGG